jgi:chemotaxis protein MotB
MSREKKEKPEDTGPTVPGYLVSFGDMMTILLTFFILLCTYATQRQAGFVADGIGSFRLAIDALGLPGFLTSDRLPTSLGADRIRYKTREREDRGERDEDDRRITDELETLRRSRVEELPRDGQIRLGLPIRFEPGSSEPLPGNEAILRHVAGLITEGGRRVEILGHADSEDLPRSQRIRLALARASRLARILESEYGAPPGGLTAGAAIRSRADATGATPVGDITLRVYRPGRFQSLRPGQEDRENGR